MMPPARFPPALLAVAFVLLSPLAAQVTESPHTIAPGKFLLEVDGVRLAYDRADAAGNTFTGVAVGSAILSVGLTSSIDLQVGADIFLKHSYELSGVRDSRSGVGDLYFRTKWTVWRNDKLGAAVAVIPYVKVPANSGGVGNDHVEGGVIVPWALQLGEGFAAGAMFQLDRVRNGADDGYTHHAHLSGFAQQNLTSAFAVYAESVVTLPPGAFASWYGSLGVGALLQVTSHVQLDYELQRGLNRRAVDWTHTFRVNWDW